MKLVVGILFCIICFANGQGIGYAAYLCPTQTEGIYTVFVNGSSGSLPC